MLQDILNTRDYECNEDPVVRYEQKCGVYVYYVTMQQAQAQNGQFQTSTGTTEIANLIYLMTEKFITFKIMCECINLQSTDN